jgi:hypothetical protein
MLNFKMPFHAAAGQLRTGEGFGGAKQLSKASVL